MAITHVQALVLQIQAGAVGGAVDLLPSDSAGGLIECAQAPIAASVYRVVVDGYAGLIVEVGEAGG